MNKKATAKRLVYSPRSARVMSPTDDPFEKSKLLRLNRSGNLKTQRKKGKKPLKNLAKLNSRLVSKNQQLISANTELSKALLTSGQPISTPSNTDILHFGYLLATKLESSPLVQHIIEHHTGDFNSFLTSLHNPQKHGKNLLRCLKIISDLLLHYSLPRTHSSEHSVSNDSSHRENEELMRTIGEQSQRIKALTSQITQAVDARRTHPLPPI